MAYICVVAITAPGKLWDTLSVKTSDSKHSVVLTKHNMCFSSLFRSRSQGDRNHKAKPLQRTNTHYGGYPKTDTAIIAYETAKLRYEQKTDHIMTWEIQSRKRNQAACKRRMEAADHSLREEQKRIDRVLVFENDKATKRWKRFEIDDKQLTKIRGLLQKRKEAELTAWTKWHQQELANAQKVFFANGEQIAAKAGAGLRRAKAKLEEAKRIDVNKVKY